MGRRRGWMAVAAAGPLVVGAAVSCSKFGGDADGEAAPDGGAEAGGSTPTSTPTSPSSTDAGAGSFCASHPNAFLCDDFERDDVADSNGPAWSPSISNGALAIEARGKDGSRALLVKMNGGFGDARVYLEAPAPDPSWKTMSISFDMEFEDVVLQGLIAGFDIDSDVHDDAGTLQPSAVHITTGDGEADAGVYLTEIEPNHIPYPVFGARVPPDAFHHYRIVVDENVLKPTARLYVDEGLVATRELTTAKGTFHVAKIGILYALRTESERIIRIDNVLIEHDT